MVSSFDLDKNTYIISAIFKTRNYENSYESDSGLEAIYNLDKKEWSIYFEGYYSDDNKKCLINEVNQLVNEIKSKFN